jgi:hypothetical protein
MNEPLLASEAICATGRKGLDQIGRSTSNIAALLSCTQAKNNGVRRQLKSCGGSCQGSGWTATTGVMLNPSSEAMDCGKVNEWFRQYPNTFDA